MEAYANEISVSYCGGAINAKLGRTNFYLHPVIMKECYDEKECCDIKSYGTKNDLVPMYISVWWQSNREIF